MIGAVGARLRGLPSDVRPSPHWIPTRGLCAPRRGQDVARCIRRTGVRVCGAVERMVEVARVGYWGWESVEERSANGTISSAQQARFAGPVVPMDGKGARMLSDIYWRQVERSTGRLVRARTSGEGVALRLVGSGPALLRFAPATVSVGPTGIASVHAIVGGLLARRPSGLIRFEQRAQDGDVVVVSAISGFHPTLAARPGAPAWTGDLYKRVQSRLHVAVARRFFARLARRVSA